MKFQNAILSLATATLSGTNVVDAKIWTLRGLGKANNNNINEVTNNNNNEVVVNNHSDPSENLQELFLEEEQGERRLPKKDKKKKKGEEKKDDEAEGASEKKKGKDGGDKKKDGDDKKKDGDKKKGKDGDKKKGKDGDKKKGKDGDKKKEDKKGKKDQKVGAEIYADAPLDVAENAGCDDIVPVSDRRVLSNGSRRRRAKAGDDKAHAKTFSTKGNKDDLTSGACPSFTTDGLLEEVEISGFRVDVPAEGKPGNCAPDAEGCEADEVGPDPTEVEGGDADVKVNEEEEAS
eukprot:scaffold26395_cov143-Skeletonema_marinoi.AAC.1